jgi:hypothetical protein
MGHGRRWNLNLKDLALASKEELEASPFSSSEVLNPEKLTKKVRNTL